MLFDSPLNRAGLLEVFIHTKQNVLIAIDPQTRFPRTFKRWANLMGNKLLLITKEVRAILTNSSHAVQLLYKLSIRSTQGAKKLMRVIKNPITLHLPPSAVRYGTSFQAEKLIKPSELVPTGDVSSFLLMIIAC